MTRINYNAKIAVLIRAMRNASGLNQDELSSAAKCSRPTINRIEALDKSSPKGSTVDDIFHVFREMGAEILISDNEVNVKFGADFLLAAQQKIEETKNVRQHY